MRRMYSENQIKAIASQAGGGLYKHKLTISITAGPSSGNKLYFVFITSKEEKITSLSSYNVHNEIGYVNGFETNSGFTSVSGMIVQPFTPFAVINGSSIATKNAYSITIDSDEVSKY